MVDNRCWFVLVRPCYVQALVPMQVDLVFGLSWMVDLCDVERAWCRSSVLQNTGTSALAAVGGATVVSDTSTSAPLPAEEVW